MSASRKQTGIGLLVGACLSFLAGAPARAQLDTLSHGGVVRDYHVHAPPSYDGSPTPVVVAFHGGFGSSDNIEEQSGLSVVADEEGFLVVYPNGTGTIPTWNGGECCGYAARENVDDVGFVDKLLDRISNTYNVDPGRVYATGISNGGAMTYRLACELTRRFAAFAPVAVTYRNDTCNPDETVALIHFHSEADENVPAGGGPGSGPSVVDWLPLDSTMARFAGYSDCADSNLVHVNDSLSVTTWTGCQVGSAVRLFLTSDGGHSWPGGMRNVIGDPVSEAVDASREMWGFFEGFRRTNVGTRDAHPRQVDRPEVQLRVFPNPARSGSAVRAEVEITAASRLNASFFDVVGRRLKVLDVGFREPGRHLLSIDSARWPPGLYFIAIQTSAGQVATAPLILRGAGPAQFN